MADKQTYRILFLVSDPSEGGKELFVKELKQVRDQLGLNSNYEIKELQSVKPEIFLKSIRDFKPHIIHFSGHGIEAGEISFEDETGKSLTVLPERLSDFFAKFSGQINCVILNTCYKEGQAFAISRHVPVVIGTKKEMGDDAAIRFSTGFYTSLEPDLSPKNIETAFDQGCFIMQCYYVNITGDQMPHLITPQKSFLSEVDHAFSSLSTRAVLESVMGLFLMGVKRGLEPDKVNEIIVGQLKKMIDHTKNIGQYELKLRNFCKNMPLQDAILSLTLLQKGMELTEANLTAVHNKIKLDLDKGADVTVSQTVNEDLSNLENALAQFTQTIEVKPQTAGVFELESSRSRTASAPVREMVIVPQQAKPEEVVLSATANNGGTGIHLSESNTLLNRGLQQTENNPVMPARSMDRNSKEENGEKIFRQQAPSEIAGQRKSLLKEIQQLKGEGNLDQAFQRLDKFMAMVEDEKDRKDMGDLIGEYNDFLSSRSQLTNEQANGKAKYFQLQLEKVTSVYESKPKIFFSYAWGQDREAIVDELYKSLKSEGDYKLVRDKIDLGYKGLISEFMKEIGRGSFVVVALSDKYLRSEYCMFELYELYRRSSLESEELLKKIYPIRVENLDLNSPKILDEYLTYWTNKEAEWRDLVKKHAAFQDKYDKVQAISIALKDLLPFLNDINALTKELLSQNDFADIKNAIRQKLKDDEDDGETGN